MIKAAALKYAEDGWFVFPAPRGEKKSHKSAEHSDGRKWGMTKDPAEIEHDWAQWPDANVGVPTGAINSIFVLEADTIAGHGVDGLASLAALQVTHGALPATRMAESPSGSLHHYFLHPLGDVSIKNSASELAPGVDVLGDGGMVIAPPSIRRDGWAYSWRNDLPIAIAPDWLVELVRKPERTGNGGGEQVTDITLLASALAVIANEGNWDQWNKVGMALFRATSGYDAGRDLFDEWSQKSTKYSATYTAKQWTKYERCPPDEIGAGSVFFWADQTGIDWRYEHRRAEQMRANIEIGDDLPQSPLPTIMTLDEMAEQLVWVGSVGGVVHRVTGTVRKRDLATIEYSASVTRINDKTVPCLKLWLNSPTRISVDALAWIPGDKQICPPPEGFDGAKSAFNTWDGLPTMPVPDDWMELSKPFRDHVDYLVPVESERKRFLQWLGHIFQRPEELPHTAYLMVTSTTGIGRNWLASALVRVLRGHVAVGVSLPELLEGGFNGRLSRKLLVIVDELREGAATQRYQRAQRLKSIITEQHRRINPKFGLESIEKNCARWLMFSNHMDALPFDNNDRRIEVVANPTTCKPPSYYDKLYRLLKDSLFVASVRQLLASVNLDSFDAGAHATLSAAKLQAIAAMKTEVEIIVEEFKEECATKLVSRREIDAMVINNIRTPFNAGHVNHAIDNAGMVNTGRRIKDANGTKHKVVIVDASVWTKEMVEQASPQALLDAMHLPSRSRTGTTDEVPF